MALNKNQGAGYIYLSVANGKLVRQHKKPTEATTERINKQGKVVYEEFFKDLIANLVSITTKDGEFGKQWIVLFEDEGQYFQVQMNYSSRYSSSFLKSLPNVNAELPIKFMPWEMEDKNDPSKKVTGITIYQDDGNGFVKVPSAYTKEEPNGLPQMKKIKIKGKEQWDDTDMMAFLEKMATSLFPPKKATDGFKPVITGDEPAF